MAVCVDSSCSLFTVLFDLFFFFNDTAPTEIYTLSLTTLFRSHFVRPTLPGAETQPSLLIVAPMSGHYATLLRGTRSEEHTSELQSRQYLVCRLLLEKKKTK